MEKVSKTYDPVSLTRILQSLERRIEALQQPKLRRIKSVAADAAQNLAVNEAGYVLDDSQNLDLVVRAEDGRLYRLSAQASAVAATSSTPAGVYVLKSGDTMTGLLILSGDPSAALGAATKQYADLKVSKSGDTITGALVIDGSADNIQLQVQANGTQTNHLLVLEDSAGNDQFTVSGDGAVVANEEGNAVNFRVESDTDANCLHVNGTNNTVQVGASAASDSAKLYVSGKFSVSGDAELNSALDHDGNTVGFFGVTPTTRPTAYTVTNGILDKNYDANATSVDELADVLYSVITDLQSLGLLQ